MHQKLYPGTQERDFGGEREEWLVTEQELDEWFREERRLQREEAIKLQDELEMRQKEQQAASEQEEARWETECKEWLRRQRAEPGLCKWFFWRNRLKEPSTEPN
ncbi:hypothetical protein EV368DRAFT_61446 [Lentinula lateritia]|nr:hypothetical protein EV368DRAFT_61446 [Lentinula lateritia]